MAGFALNKLQELLQNPFSMGVKKFFFEILKEKYADNEQIIEKMTESVRTERDYTAFGKLIMAVYEKGFYTAVEQHRSILAERGLKATIKPANQEKSG